MTEIQHSNFHSFGVEQTLALLQTPPYSSTYDCCRTAVPLVGPVMSVNSEKQMHCLRFPTPPTTPHKEQTIQTSPAQHRTLSVIMKVNHGSHHVAETLLNEFSAVDSTVGQRTLPSNEFLCDWIGCRLSFKTLETLVIHVTQIHANPSSDDGLYYCMWEGCSRSTRGFNARYKMLVHVRTHTKEKPHQCHLCKKSFSRAENLKIHIRSHSGERPYQCTFEGCRKAYSNSSDRFKHTRTHSMEKPYICKVPGCQKRYTDPSSLRKHVKTFRHMECSLAQVAESYLPSHRFEAHSVDDNSEKLLQIRIDDIGDEVMNSKGEIYLPSSYVHAVDCCRKDENLMNFKWNNYYPTHTPSSCTGYWITTENVDFYSHRFPPNSATSAIHTDLPLDLRTTRR